MPRLISRRDLLKRAGFVGAAAAFPSPRTLSAADPAPLGQAARLPGPTPPREALEHLTADQLQILEAFVARLIPSDASGPGAAEARAAHYIDRALGSALASSRGAYASGLAALDQYARSARGGPFAQLSAVDQDAILTDVESAAAPGFPDSGTFFSLVRFHAIQGTFCDPYYGGNANFVGWDLIGYPGVRTAVGPEEQRLGAETLPNHKSAYDYALFTKAAANRSSDSGDHHGD
jgi:gluconate 2-dehydrogenase gamma chain